MNIGAFELRTKNYIIEMKTYDNLEKHMDSTFFEVGHVCVGDYEEVLKIIYNKNCFNDCGGHCRLVDYYGDHILVIDKYFYDNFMKDTNFKITASLLLHELGHFINGDLLKDTAVNSDSKRILALSIGRILPEESEADLFAVKEIGKSSMINAIDKLISVRRKRNDMGMDLAIKEFNLRKDNIKKMR